MLNLFKTILIAADGSEASDRAISFAGHLARDQRCRLVVVHVDELIAGRRAVHHFQVLEPEIQMKIKQQVSELMARGIEAHYEVRQARANGAAHAIEDSAAHADADLIVVGRESSGRLHGFLGGDLAQRLVQRARCPVQPSARVGAPTRV